MPTISVQASTVSSAPDGDVIVLRCSGILLPAPDGNADMAEMLKTVRARIADLQPAGVVFDLNELRYSWGDHIGGLAHAVVERDPVGIKPSCVVANGKTAEALQPLFRSSFIFGMYDIPLLQSVEEGVEFVRGRLAKEAGG